MPQTLTLITDNYKSQKQKAAVTVAMQQAFQVRQRVLGLVM